MSKTETINKIIKEIKEKSILEVQLGDSVEYHLIGTIKEFESFLTSSLEKAIQETIKEEKRRAKAEKRIIRYRTHGMTPTRFYEIWKSMRARCRRQTST